VVFANHEVMTLDTTNMCNLFLLFLSHFGSELFLQLQLDFAAIWRERVSDDWVGHFELLIG
jgi:hypothetical protein